jgi:radical SAM protein with 4Fe4S-binding SPASM domain
MQIMLSHRLYDALCRERDAKGLARRWPRRVRLGISRQAFPGIWGLLAGHCLTAMSISFGSTPAIKSKSRSRCRSGMLAKIACVAIRQSFADRGVTPAHRHRAYKCAALRAASRVSGALTNGNSPRTRSQRVNRSGLSAPCRTCCCGQICAGVCAVHSFRRPHSSVRPPWQGWEAPLREGGRGD